jgi:MFS family permease
MCLAIIPVGLTTVASPPHIPSLRFRFEILLQASRVALIGTLLSGLVTGAFWIIGPVLGRQLGLDSGGVALLIGCGIIGGAVAQLPAGRLSDRVDRRIVIGAFAAGGALAALAGAFFAADSAIVLYAVFFLVGAGTLPIYALCIAHASDNSNVPLVELTSGTLMMNSVGSIIGPLAVAALMGWFGSLSYFAYVFVCLLVVSLWTLVRGLSVKHVRSHEEHAAMLPRTTQAAAELILPPTGDAAGKSDDSTNPS